MDNMTPEITDTMIELSDYYIGVMYWLASIADQRDSFRLVQGEGGRGETLESLARV